MDTKKCSKCSKIKPLTDFYKKGLYYRSICKVCLNKESRVWEKSKKGVLYSIFKCQEKASTQRGHPPPQYSFDEFKAWAMGQDIFHVLYENWVNSGHKKDLKPSADRVDDYIGYRFDNIRIVMWIENLKNYREDVKNGINTKDCKSIVELTMDGDFIKEHYSISSAGRLNNLDPSGIVKCCKGKVKFCGNSKWIYKTDYDKLIKSEE